VHPITISRLPSPAAALFDPGQSQSSAGIHSIIHSASRLRLLPARVNLSPCMPAGSIIDFPDHASCQFRCSLLIVGACARKSLFVFFFWFNPTVTFLSITITSKRSFFLRRIECSGRKVCSSSVLRPASSHLA
jgi:hypothetical protein